MKLLRLIILGSQLAALSASTGFGQGTNFDNISKSFVPYVSNKKGLSGVIVISARSSMDNASLEGLRNTVFSNFPANRILVLYEATVPTKVLDMPIFRDCLKERISGTFPFIELEKIVKTKGPIFCPIMGDRIQFFVKVV